MNYQITSDNIEISASMEALAKEKFARVEHRVKDAPEGSKAARIVMNTAPDGMFTVRAEVRVNGDDYFSDETDYTLEGALIKTVEELINMMEKKKETRARKDKGASGVDATEELLKEDVI